MAETKMWIYVNFVLLLFAFWEHVAYGYGLNTMSDPLLNKPEVKEGSLEYLTIRKRDKRSPHEQDFGLYDSEGNEDITNHRIRKRESEPSYFTPAYCRKIGLCGLDPNLSILCLVKCNFDREPLLKPYLGLVPELPMFMCQTVNTIFPDLPKQIHQSASKLPNVKSYLKLLNVKPDDAADFAKTSANALPVAMIRNVRGPIFDDFKPAIKKLEIHEPDKTARRKRLNFPGSKVLESLLSMVSIGQKFVNPKCDKTNLDDEALTLISAMKIRKCSMDVLMPGYFVFNSAPKVASSHEIAPLLRAWNMPLLMFTGVKCCMVQFALHKVRTKCPHKYDILDKPHGLSTSNGPDTVCGAIPSFVPIQSPSPVKPTLQIKLDLEGSSKSSATNQNEGTASASPCGKDNKNELEECMTESVSIDYSEEATEVPGNVNTTEVIEDIKSGEMEYY